MSTSLAGLQPWLQPYARYLVALAPMVRVTSVRRSRSEQAYLYRRFLAGESQYPVAPPGQSLHEYGRAFDVKAPSELLNHLGHIWEQMGGRWGGRGGDPIHFEA